MASKGGYSENITENEMKKANTSRKNIKKGNNEC